MRCPPGRQTPSVAVRDSCDLVHTFPPNPDSGRWAHCLDRLSKRERTVLMLAFYEDMPADELALELGLTPGNVRVIRHRALERLRLCVTGEAQ